MQAAAAAELLSGLQKKGIHTVIETNASLPVLSKLLSHSDCVIADYKHYNGSVLHEVTGAMLNTVEHNIIKIIERKIELHLRIPLIHGFNDTDTDGFIKSLARLSSYGAYNVELLPYHEYGRDKWRECGLKYGIKDGFVSPEFILKLKTALMDAGIKVIST
jgi:Pyruvate-formate lyase-activating enzyme